MRTPIASILSAVCWLLVTVLPLPAQTSGARTLRIITLGDSITKGVRPGVTADQTFAALLQKQLILQGIATEVTNVGIGGERTDMALKRLEKDVLSKKPDLVTVMYGTNDSYVDKDKAESRITSDAYESGLTEIVTRLKAAGIAPVLMTEPCWAEGAKSNGVGEHPNVRLAPYMERCRKVAKAQGVPLVDHYGHWSAEAKRGTKLMPWTTDACHPNPQGHEQLAARILQTVLPWAQSFADQHGSWLPDIPYTVQLDTVTHGYDGKMCWVHPRAGILSGNSPSVVLTMQKLLLTGSDVFYALNDTRTDDLKTWSPITEHLDTLGRRDEGNGVIVAACDFWPKWHAKSGKLLGIGHTVRYLDNKVMAARKRETTCSIYDPEKKTWTAWTTIKMPDDPKFENCGAGSVQRVDMENGDILLPVYFGAVGEKDYRVTVLRCSFDGTTLKYLEHGSELAIKGGRGFVEPSLARSAGRYFLTLRNDNAGYICTSDDGLHYTEPKKWTWTDGADLGNYNTQQHWVTHGDDLYLVYNRKGANNDHIIRHRAPLFMGKVNKETLQVMRDTERILVPERGARLGNFGVTEVSPGETWVTVAEWMQTFSPTLIVPVDNPYGADNSVFAARIKWKK
jgi:lysophospholipase L1-like esterase